MPELVVLVGVSGVGKSTWAARHLPGHRLLTADAIRRKRVAPGIIIAQMRRSAEAAASGRTHDLVTDATNVRASDRRWWLGLAKDHGYRAVAVLLHPPSLDVLAARQRARGGEATPMQVVRKQMAEWDAAVRAVDGEAWDEVKHVGQRRVEGTFRSSRDW